MTRAKELMRVYRTPARRPTEELLEVCCPGCARRAPMLIGSYVAGEGVMKTQKSFANSLLTDRDVFLRPLTRSWAHIPASTALRSAADRPCSNLQAITAQPLTDARARLARLEWRASIGIPVPSAEITEASAHLQGLLAPPAKK